MATGRAVELVGGSCCKTRRRETRWNQANRTLKINRTDDRANRTVQPKVCVGQVRGALLLSVTGTAHARL